VESGRLGDHLSEDDCVDFGRRVPAPQRRARLARHLDAGCARCSRAVRLWSALASFAAEEPSFDPPETALREVKGLFARQRRPRLGERLARAATLVFDSFRQPLPAGVRAAAPTVRKMLFRSGPYIVRLRLEPQAGSGRLSIVGQIEDVQHPDLSLHDFAVVARKGGRKPVDWTLTNHLGEFLLEPEEAEDLQLAVALPRVGIFTVPLAGEGEKEPRAVAARGFGRPGGAKRSRPR
jgi:hypothetical protein